MIFFFKKISVSIYNLNMLCVILIRIWVGVTIFSLTGWSSSGQNPHSIEHGWKWQPSISLPWYCSFLHGPPVPWSTSSPWIPWDVLHLSKSNLASLAKNVLYGGSSGKARTGWSGGWSGSCQVVLFWVSCLLTVLSLFISFPASLWPK